MANETVKNNEVLIATLGENPQVVIRSLDLLEAQGYHIDEVVSVCIDGEKAREGLTRLDEALQRPNGPSHRSLLVVGETGSNCTAWAEAEVTALLQTLYREVKVRKRVGQRIHLMLAEGPKVMSTYALVVAQLLFDESDQAWQFVSGCDSGNGQSERRGGPDERSGLMPVPVLRWMPMATLATDLAPTDDPWQVINCRYELQQQEHDIRLHAFLHSLTPTQRAVVDLLAKGLNNRTIAAQRGVSINTVTKQISTVYAKWRRFFGLPDKMSVSSQIVAELKDYFTRQGNA